MSPKHSRINARSLIIGNSSPYHYEQININNSLIYTGQLTANVNAKVSGVILSIYDDTVENINVTVSISNSDGKVYNHLTNTSTITTSVSNVGTKIPFRKHFYANAGETYFVLVQFNTTSTTAQMAVFSSPNVLIYPLCGTLSGNLSTLNYFLIPTYYNDGTCPAGNLY